ncbi:sensor histidine kinase [Dactylosporangium vinaceum]|uniref:Oxygen sensor histidine kinase NreB n=1 Tax=Dactylosporangium vinaceum TaxID=53362 RepID=A0ABV5MBY4_9ACTN|nr:sensor histidine kinase [Dactylosporangium vinaceum]UAC01329.1 sensor histidine kinase [Dactylosporangium vinaceum]
MPVRWVPFVLCGAVLAAGLTARPLDLSALGFAAGVLALAGVEALDRGRRAWLVVRVALLALVAPFDPSGLTGALFITVPFAAYFTMGRRTAVVLGAAGAGLLALFFAAGGAGDVGDLVMYAVGLVLALTAAAFAVGRMDAVAELAAARERNRLAREIHDSLGHHLTAIAVQLEKAEAFRDRDQQAAARAVTDARWSAKQALAEVRDSVRTLRDAPPSVRDLARHAPDVTVSVLGDEAAVPAPVRLAVYRAAQEALTNARRHGNARAMAVAADFRGGRATLTVTDDGTGLPESPGAGFGLQGMRERVEQLGGTLTLAPADSGVRLTVTIPAPA